MNTNNFSKTQSGVFVNKSMNTHGRQKSFLKNIKKENDILKKKVETMESKLDMIVSILTNQGKE